MNNVIETVLVVLIITIVVFICASIYEYCEFKEGNNIDDYNK